MPRLKKSKIISVSIALFYVGVILLTAAPRVSANSTPPVGCPGGAIGPPSAGTTCPYNNTQVTQFCADPSKLPTGQTVYCPNGTGGVTPVQGTDSSGASAAQGNHDCVTPNGGNLDKNNCGILSDLLTFINVLSALVGIVVVIMIAVGGIQYSAARDNPQATAAAKRRIINAILGLLAYLFLWAFLQYIVPGGVF